VETDLSRFDRHSAPFTPRFSRSDVVLIVVFAGLVVLGTVLARFPIKMPGHSGVIWMALLVGAWNVLRKPGAVAIVGILSGVIGAVTGIGDKGALDTFFSYAAAGLGVEAVAVFAAPSAWSCALGGAAGNGLKFAAKSLLESWLGLRSGFLVLGWSGSLLGHALFGLAGGLLGYYGAELFRRSRFASPGARR